MTDPDDALALDIAKERLLRLRAAGLPDETLSQIVRDAWERALLWADARNLEPTIEADAVGVGSFLLAMIPGNVASGVEAKVLGLFLREVWALLDAKAKRDQAEEAT